LLGAFNLDKPHLVLDPTQQLAQQSIPLKAHGKQLNIMFAYAFTKHLSKPIILKKKHCELTIFITSNSST